MPEYRDGEVIPMQWEDPPTEWYVAGHVAFDVAIAEVQQHMDCHHLERDKEEVKYRLGECRHLWAQWVPVDEDDVQEFGFYLNTFKRKSKNRFAVTKVYDIDEIEYRRKQKQQREERAAEVEAMLRKRYPEILTIEVAEYSDGRGAEFTIEGIQDTVGWREAHPFSVRVNLNDHEAWRRLYQGRHVN